MPARAAAIAMAMCHMNQPLIQNRPESVHKKNREKRSLPPPESKITEDKSMFGRASYHGPGRAAPIEVSKAWYIVREPARFLPIRCLLAKRFVSEY
ncbi:hypothetical protein PCASD_17474 [Puccinia coronata f. sp. avenae]|uniref:Uncharacterized protein n=1 Tax=Puccinia coronata f. sp. avenae TaxID=200324 RepID=A0A2N5S3E7_9BASI|nr:hypothetical protein PCASD_23451 [Puccinia coronata f. sp. avenae]PLW28491.1 hypothetical protein PCASD_17474 [Puccinia coronata f. sp. avenae]